MGTIKAIFSDNDEGNHMMVALDFYEDLYKQNTLQIPEEYSRIDIVDISIEKMFLDKPINQATFFKLSKWLLQQFEKYDNAVFTFICSFDELDNRHSDLQPQLYRWRLFDSLYQRMKIRECSIQIQDFIVGPEDFATYGRAFYRSSHAPIVSIIAAHLQDKQS